MRVHGIRLLAMGLFLIRVTFVAAQTPSPPAAGPFEALLHFEASAILPGDLVQGPNHHVDALAGACVLGAASAVLAQPAFQTPPVLSARELLPPEMLAGPTFDVDDLVPTDGLLGHFTLRSGYGTFTTDQNECGTWAAQQSGYDPSNPGTSAYAVANGNGPLRTLSGRAGSGHVRWHSTARGAS